MKKTQQTATTTPPAEPHCTTCKNGLLSDGAYCACSQGVIRKRFDESKLAKVAAAPVTPSPVYHQSDASKIAYLLERSEPEQCEFFHALMDEWEKGLYSLTEAAFMTGADAVGINWISDIEDLTREDAMFRGLRLVMIVDDWFADFLRRILKSYDHRNPLTPDDVADDLQSCLLDFQHEIRDARKLIENHPETVAGHIRRAIQNRPELVA